MKYKVLSPDGFTIDFHKNSYPSLKQAQKTLNDFIENYKHQGYYSTIQNGQRLQIPLEQIANNCNIIKIN